MLLGPGPGVSEVVRVGTGKLDSVETIADKGTAVGFVAKRETEILGVDEVLVATVTVGLAELEEAGPDVDGCELEA